MSRRRRPDSHDKNLKPEPSPILNLFVLVIKTTTPIMVPINATDNVLRGNSGTVAGDDEVFAKDVFVVVIVTFV